MWFFQKCNIPSGGFGPEKWLADESNMHTDGAENELIVRSGTWKD
jgi:hypothetical protein